MLVSSPIAPPVTRCSSKPVSSCPNLTSQPEDPTDSYELSRKDGALRGLITGLATGAIIDAAMVGGPAVIGYLQNGLPGAVIGILALPVACGVFSAVNGAFNPEAYAKEKWAAVFER